MSRKACDTRLLHLRARFLFLEGARAVSDLHVNPDETMGKLAERLLKRGTFIYHGEYVDMDKTPRQLALPEDAELKYHPLIIHFMPRGKAIMVHVKGSPDSPIREAEVMPAFPTWSVTAFIPFIRDNLRGMDRSQGRHQNAWSIWTVRGKVTDPTVTVGTVLQEGSVAAFQQRLFVSADCNYVLVKCNIRSARCGGMRP